MSSSSIQKLFVEVSQHSNDLLMNLWGRKRTPILFLHHLGTTPILILNNYKVIREQTLYDLNNFKPHNFPPTFFYLFIYLYLFIFLYIWIYSCVSYFIVHRNLNIICILLLYENCINLNYIELVHSDFRVYYILLFFCLFILDFDIDTPTINLHLST